VLLAVAIAATVVELHGQSISVSTVKDALHVKASGLTFIEGETLDHLRNGRAVVVDFVMSVLSGPDGPAVADSRQRYSLSFDIWEERFAVTRVGTPPRSISHLRPREAEAWCVDNLTLPVSALGRLGREAPFWMRLEYRIQDPAPVPAADETSGLTLRGLIDLLGRRRRSTDLGRTLRAGPFRLSD